MMMMMIINESSLQAESLLKNSLNNIRILEVNSYLQKTLHYY